jgi:adenylate cyclase
MKKRLPLITGLLLLLVGAVCYIYQPPFLVDLSRRLFDLFLTQQARPVQSDTVTIVDIDDDALETYGQWPWSRDRLAELTDRLWEQGAAVVVFDIIFAEPDRTSPLLLVNDWTERLGATVSIQGLETNQLDYDALFAKSLQGGPSVLGCFLVGTSEPLTEFPEGETSYFRSTFFEKGLPQRAWLPHANGIQAPLPQLAEAAAGQAFINTLPDLDNMIRSTPLVYAYGPGRIYPSLALEAIRLYAEAQKVGIIYDAVGADGVQHILIQDGIIPTDAHGRLTLNYRTTRFPRWSVKAVLEKTLPAEALQDKIVLIGTAAAGLEDLVATPFQSEFPGVEVHATVVDNVLAGDILREPRGMVTVNLMVLLLGGVLVVVLVDRASAVISFLLVLLAQLGMLATSYWFLSTKQLIVMPVVPVLVWGCVFLGMIAVKYWQEERGRKQVRTMFGTMVSPDVLKYLEENPDSFSLTGTRTEATMFFSDVAGFTTISESLEPEQLADLLNRYLSPMTEIIMASGGYVDKYEGDAIMAEWGVPFPVVNHAAVACEAALKQQEKLAELRATLKNEFGHSLHVRMGINTGTVTAGNMGSSGRFQYTVMGDAVNQAARFESANKCYGSLIMVGETTYASVQDLFEFRQLDLIIVKGKSKPIRIFELLTRAGEMCADKKRVVALYEEALALHWERRFAEAIAKLDEALAVMKDEPAHWLRQRLIGYLNNPPLEGWNGEFVNPNK